MPIEVGIDDRIQFRWLWIPRPTSQAHVGMKLNIDDDYEKKKSLYWYLKRYLHPMSR